MQKCFALFGILYCSGFFSGMANLCEKTDAEVSKEVDALLWTKARMNTWHALPGCGDSYEQSIYRYQAAKQLLAEALKKHPMLFDHYNVSKSVVSTPSTSRF